MANRIYEKLRLVKEVIAEARKLTDAGYGGIRFGMSAEWPIEQRMGKEKEEWVEFLTKEDS